MGVRMTIEIEPPVTEEDMEVMTGASMTLLALITAVSSGQQQEEPEDDEDAAPAKPGGMN
jgi:hypothetical protein